MDVRTERNDRGGGSNVGFALQIFGWTVEPAAPCPGPVYSLAPCVPPRCAHTELLFREAGLGLLATTGGEFSVFVPRDKRCYWSSTCPEAWTNTPKLVEKKTQTMATQARSRQHLMVFDKVPTQHEDQADNNGDVVPWADNIFKTVLQASCSCSHHKHSWAL